MLLSNINRVLNYFQNKNHKTPLFSYLADKYLEELQVEKAEEVCAQGQKQYPQSAVGKYMQAKIDKLNNDWDAYLANLEECIKLDSGFLQAYYEIISEGKATLSYKKLYQYYQKLAHNNFADPDFLEEYAEFGQKRKKTEKEEKSKDLKFKSLESDERPETATRLRISRKTRDDNDESDEIDLKIPVPTMTFVDVLMKQELYDQALEVLDIIEKKTNKDELVRDKREKIQKLKEQSEEE
mgnify:CR=1 FL=1